MNGITLVTGGTGKTGARLVERLREEELPVRCASRSGKASAGAEGTAFDWYQAEGHDRALAGVDRVYLVAPIGSSNPVEVMEPFIERAIAQGVRRFVLLSSSLIDEGGPAMGAVHAVLRRRAPEWAVLRPSWFMENFTVDPHLASIREDDAIHSATDDGLVPFIGVDDIAEVALRALTDEHSVNAGIVMTGPATLSYGDVAEIIGNARGIPVRHIRLTAEELTARLTRFGIPSEFASMLAGLDRAIAAGAEARTTDSVAQTTGRDASSFADFAAKHASTFRRPASG